MEDPLSLLECLCQYAYYTIIYFRKRRIKVMIQNKENNFYKAELALINVKCIQ